MGRRACEVLERTEVTGRRGTGTAEKEASSLQSTYETRRKVGEFIVVSDRATSGRMAGVRQYGTAAERAVRSALHSIGIRFRVSNRDLPGSPDIANRSRKWAVFVHGCFWHRHARCRRTTTPTRNRDFWLAKFEANRRRDGRVARALRQMGYVVMVVWECQTQRPDLAGRLDRTFRAQGILGLGKRVSGTPGP